MLLALNSELLTTFVSIETKLIMFLPKRNTFFWPLKLMITYKIRFYRNENFVVSIETKYSNPSLLTSLTYDESTFDELFFEAIFLTFDDFFTFDEP